ncbi:MAG: DUF116 domain-containing protein [Candidatus Humimicrobiaceae bacterium]
MKKRLLKNKKIQKKIDDINFEDRVLLLPHCLRPSESCSAKMSKNGLICKDDCNIDCSVGHLRKLAEKLGYKGICIAPGGAMTIRFIIENQPKGIVAIACRKELEEGIEAINEITKKNKLNGNMPAIAVVPLIKDGCVDTIVDLEEAKRIVMLKKEVNEK